MTSHRLAEELRLLPDYLGHHILLTFAALSAGILVCVPLGCLVSRVKSLQWLVLGLVSVLQTIPGIALLALMVPLLGQIGFLPAFIALFLYSLLPILRNTVTGILGVDPSVIEAARGVGMTSLQMLLGVELPLAMSVIMAGIRTSAVWVVGTATLATPVGATSLGNYIFSGLQTQNHTSVLVGCVAASALAIVLDQLVRLAEISAQRKSAYLTVAAVVGLAVLCIAGASPALMRPSREVDRAPAIVGAKTFTEQYILADLLARKLQEAGIPASTKPGLGSSILFNALVAGSVDCCVEYSGTIWANVLKRQDLPPKHALLEEMAGSLKEKYGVVVLGPLGFENTYALAMRGEDAARLHLRVIDDLVPVARNLSIGSDYEFFRRPEWEALCRTYRLKFAVQRTFDPTLMYEAVREKKVDVISAYSTDGRIIDYGLTILDDNRQALPPYDAVLLVSPRTVTRKNLVDVLRRQVGQIDNDLMRQANRLVDVSRHPVSDAAAFLEKAMEPRPAIQE